MAEEPAYPLPQATAFTAPFWDACQAETLEVNACADCLHLFLPGGPVCPKCWSKSLTTTEVSGRGQVSSFVVYRRTYHPAVPAPYVVAIVTLEEGPRLVSNIVNSIKVGLKVQVVFKEESGFKLPGFEPVTEEKLQ